MSDEERANDKEFWSDDLPRPLIANVMPGEVAELLLARLQLCVPGRRTLHAKANLHSSVTPPMCLITTAHFVSCQISRERARCLSVLRSSKSHMIRPPM